MKMFRNRRNSSKRERFCIECEHFIINADAEDFDNEVGTKCLCALGHEHYNPELCIDFKECEDDK